MEEERRNVEDVLQKGRAGACRGCRLQGGWERLLVGQLGVFPRAASLYVTAALKLLVMNGPKGPKLILYSHKALMQGKVGANGTLGKQSSGGGWGGGRVEAAVDAAINGTHTNTHTQTGGKGAEDEDQNENKPLQVMKHHQKQKKKVGGVGRRGTAKQAGTLEVTAHTQKMEQREEEAAAFRQTWPRGAPTYPLIF